MKNDKRRRPQRSGGQADKPAKQQPRQQAQRQQTGVHPGPRYGILGGTFDPPHLGHLALAQEVYVRLALDRVWFLPAGVPPHKTGKVISPAADRLAMLERAVAADDRFGVLTVELERPGPSYTVDTLRELRTLWGADAEMVLILGWDMLDYLPQWHDAAGVVAGADKIAVVHRPGFIAEESDLVGLERELPGLREKLALVPLPQLAISGTEIRSRVAHMLPIRYLTPDPVATYIESRALYRTAEHTVEHTDGPPNDQPDGRTKGGER